MNLKILKIIKKQEEDDEKQKIAEAIIQRNAERSRKEAEDWERIKKRRKETGSLF